MIRSGLRLIFVLVFRYKAMEECQKKGKTKAIGVSNFSQKEMERLVKEVSIVRLYHVHPIAMRHLPLTQEICRHQRHISLVRYNLPNGPLR